MSNENTLRWEDIDSHLLARQEIRAQRDLYEWLGPDTSGPVVPAIDEHRVAVLNRRAVEPFGDVLAADADREYRERQAHAATRIRLAEALGEQPADADLRLVASPSGQQQVEAILATRAKTRAAALSEAKRTVRGYHDGSRVESFSGDYQGWTMAADRAMASVPQIARHRAMAEGKPMRKRWWGR